MTGSSPVDRRRRVRLDLAPLRDSRSFRRLFVSGLVTSLGSTMTMVALPFQVAQLTGSYVAVGLLGLAELVPLVVFGLYGGTLADTVDRRRLIVVTEIAAALLTTVLTVNALLAQPSVWVIYVVSMLFAAVDGLQRPSLEAALPQLVAHDQLAAAGALSSLKRTVSSIVGPAAGGLVAATWGPAAAYGIDTASFVVSFALLIGLPALSVRGGGTQRPSTMRHMAEGLRYARSRPDLLGTYLVDIAAMVFAFSYALYPFVVQEFDAPWALGLLYSAEAVGALAVTLTSGWLSRSRRHGRGLVLAAMAWGTFTGLVGVAPTIWWVIGLLTAAGAADMLSGQFRMLMWNQTIPDDMRGRMAGIELLSYAIGPLLGQVRSTVVAQATSLRTSFVTGGIVCIGAVGGIAAMFSSLWRYDVMTDVNALSVRDARRERTEPDDV